MVRQDRWVKEREERPHIQHLLISHTVDIAIDVTRWWCGGGCRPVDAIGQAGEAIKVVVECSNGWGRRWCVVGGSAVFLPCSAGNLPYSSFCFFGLALWNICNTSYWCCKISDVCFFLSVCLSHRNGDPVMHLFSLSQDETLDWSLKEYLTKTINSMTSKSTHSFVYCNFAIYESHWDFFLSLILFHSKFPQTLTSQVHFTAILCFKLSWPF